MLQGEKILVTGPAGQVAFPVCEALAKENEVVGIARFSNPDDRARVEAAGVKAVKLDLGVDSFDALDDDFTYVLNFAVVKSPAASTSTTTSRSTARGPGRLMYHTRERRRPSCTVPRPPSTSPRAGASSRRPTPSAIATGSWA